MTRRASLNFYFFGTIDFPCPCQRRCVEDVGNWAMANRKRVGVRRRIAAVTAAAVVVLVVLVVLVVVVIVVVVVVGF
jgi:hypothetical protein